MLFIIKKKRFLETFNSVLKNAAKRTLLQYLSKTYLYFLEICVGKKVYVNTYNVI